jgi:predicted small secreted protein
MEEKIQTIPFVKPARVGNFKIWRSKIELDVMPDITEEQKKLIEEKKGKVKRQKVAIEAINISNLDGSWMIRIPETFEMFSMLTAVYDGLYSDNTDIKERSRDYLSTVFTNMMYASSITNGYYHQGLFMVGAAYTDPTLLSDKKKFKAFKHEAEGVMTRFLAWRKEFDKVVGRELSEDEMRQDEAAQGIMQKMEEDADREAQN